MFAALVLAACGSGPAETGPAGSPSPSLATPTATAGAAATPAAPRVYALQMVDVSVGWALTTDERVLRTADGGQRWSDVSPDDPAWRAVTFDEVAWDVLDAANAWLLVPAAGGASGILLRTQDGGRSWLRELAPSASGFLSFADPAHGWLLHMNPGAAGGEAAVLWATADGGAHWAEAAITAGKSGGLPAQGDKRGITLRDASAGWLACFAPAPGRACLYRSQDGGRTWRPELVRAPARYGMAEVATAPPIFFTGETGVLPLAFNGGKPPAGAVAFYVTRDGGATWSATTPVSSLGPTSLIDAQHWRTIGAPANPKEQPSLLVTDDAGAHWRSVTANIGLGPVVQLDFVSPDVGWAVDPAVASGLIVTRDGGRTWSAVDVEVGAAGAR